MASGSDEVTIRPARLGDADAMVAITAEVFGPYAIDRMIEEMIGRPDGATWVDIKARSIRRAIEHGLGSCFVAELGGRVVGFATAAINAVAERGTIDDLAVAADCQKRGVGRRLIAAAVERFRELGLKQAKIETLTCNEAGRHLYPAAGFREVARQIHYVMPLD